MPDRTLDVTSEDDAKKKISDVEVTGNTDMWTLLCKASSKEQGWMKSTKACNIVGGGCVLQVSTQQDDQVAEALVYLPDVNPVMDPDSGVYELKKAKR
jgi:hypothetical protein